MAATELPANLVRALGTDGAGPLRAWAAGLPAAIGRAGERWSLRLGEPYQPGGAASWVAPARTPSGETVVLKLGWRHEESLHEAGGSASLGWSGSGASDRAPS